MNNVFDREVELQKIQILDSDFRGWFSFMASILSGAFIGLLILVATLFYQGTIDYLGFWIGLIVVFAFVALFGGYFMRNMNNDHLSYINGLMQKIENCESLPSINQLAKVKRLKAF